MKRGSTVAGQIELLLLSVVAKGPAHGYAILSALRAKTGGRLDLAEGTIYPALYRLEHGGLLTSDVRTVAGRGRRTYRLTAAGRAALRHRRRVWRELVGTVEAILGGAPAADHG